MWRRAGAGRDRSAPRTLLRLRLRLHACGQTTLRARAVPKVTYFLPGMQWPLQFGVHVQALALPLQPASSYPPRSIRRLHSSTKIELEPQAREAACHSLHCMHWAWRRGARVVAYDVGGGLYTCAYTRVCVCACVRARACVCVNMLVYACMGNN